MSILGSNDLLSYCHKCNIDLSPELRMVIAKYMARSNRGGRRKLWLSLLPRLCPIPSWEGLDLLDKLLVYDHDVRLMAREAMMHPFFDEVRDTV